MTANTYAGRVAKERLGYATMTGYDRGFSGTEGGSVSGGFSGGRWTTPT